MRLKIYYSIVFSFLFFVSTFSQINDKTNYVSTSKDKDFFTLSESGKSTTLYIGSNDYPGVIRALNDLKTDIGKVTDTEPEIAFDHLPAQKELVIVGTLGKSPVIDQLVENKKLDVSIIKGKWNHMMDQTHVNYTSWREPDIESIPETTRLDLKKEAQMRLAIEGSGMWWPNDSTEAVLPTFNSYHDTAFYVEVFNRGTTPFNYSVQSDVPWVIVSSWLGSVMAQERLWVTTDWEKAPKGKHYANLTVSGAGNRKISVIVPVNNTETKETLPGKGFVESNGYVSINAVNYAHAVSQQDYHWHRLNNYGKIGSGITLFPATMPKQEATESVPHLEYKVFVKDTGTVNIQVYLGSTIDYSGGKGLHYAIAFDDQTPQIINSTLKKPGEHWQNNNSDKVMMDNVRVD